MQLDGDCYTESYSRSIAPRATPGLLSSSRLVAVASFHSDVAAVHPNRDFNKSRIRGYIPASELPRMATKLELDRTDGSKIKGAAR